MAPPYARFVDKNASNAMLRAGNKRSGEMRNIALASVFIQILLVGRLSADEAVLQQMSSPNIFIMTSQNGSLLIDSEKGEIIAKKQIADPRLAFEYFNSLTPPGSNAEINIDEISANEDKGVLEVMYPNLKSEPYEVQYTVLQDLYFDSAFADSNDRPAPKINATTEEMESCRRQIVEGKRTAAINDALADGSPMFDGLLSIRLLEEGVPAWEIENKLAEIKDIKKKEREMEENAAALEYRRITLTNWIDPDKQGDPNVKTPAQIEEKGNIESSTFDPLGAIGAAGLAKAVGGATTSAAARGLVQSLVEDIALDAATPDDWRASLKDANETIKQRNLSCAASPNSPVCK